MVRFRRASPLTGQTGVPQYLLRGFAVFLHFQQQKLIHLVIVGFVVKGSQVLGHVGRFILPLFVTVRQRRTIDPPRRMLLLAGVRRRMIAAVLEPSTDTVPAHNKLIQGKRCDKAILN